MFGLLFFPYSERGALSGGHSARGSHQGGTQRETGTVSGGHSTGDIQRAAVSGGHSTSAEEHGPKCPPWLRT